MPKSSSDWTPIDGLKGAVSRRPSPGSALKEKMSPQSWAKVESAIQSLTLKISEVVKTEHRRYKPK